MLSGAGSDNLQHSFVSPPSPSAPSLLETMDYTILSHPAFVLTIYHHLGRPPQTLVAQLLSL